jgi:phosphohistidine phosphatase
MKELIFVRHAKSDWGNEHLKDIDRFLSERGYSDAYFHSEWYAKEKKAPALIISSTATRALNTALIFARALQFDMNNFRLAAETYETNTPKLISFIQKQDDSFESIMMFGHNPVTTNICNELSEEMFFDNVPTCGLVSMEFDIKSWADLEPKKGKLNFYRFPKDYRNKD